MSISRKEFEEFMQEITGSLSDIVFNEIYTAVMQNPNIRKNLNPAFPFPKTLRIGILNNCLAVEYVGPEAQDKDKFEINGIYQPDQDVFNFLGIDLSHLVCNKISVTQDILDWSFFLGESMTYLTERY